MLRPAQSVDVLGRVKPPPITLSAKRVRFKTDIQGNAPCSRQRHAAFMVDGVRMLVFGGASENGSAESDLNVFNLGSATWDPYSITGSSPDAREGVSLERDFSSRGHVLIWDCGLTIFFFFAYSRPHRSLFPRVCCDFWWKEWKQILQ
jgi:hypothetical protein